MDRKWTGQLIKLIMNSAWQFYIIVSNYFIRASLINDVHYV